jgi:hypothetical protein
VPAALAGEVTEMDVALFTVTAVPGMPPNETVASLPKFVPVIVIPDPPLDGPVDGEIPVTDGAAYVKRSAELVALVALPIVTVTSTVPAAWAGAVTAIEVVLLSVTAVAALPPNDTAAPA